MPKGGCSNIFRIMFRINIQKFLLLYCSIIFRLYVCVNKMTPYKKKNWKWPKQGLSSFFLHVKIQKRVEGPDLSDSSVQQGLSSAKVLSVLLLTRSSSVASSAELKPKIILSSFYPT